MSNIKIEVAASKDIHFSSELSFIKLFSDASLCKKLEALNKSLQAVFKLSDPGSLSGGVFQNWIVEGFVKDKGTPTGNEICYVVKTFAEASGFDFECTKYTPEETERLKKLLK